ncbi:MAG TPA: hypothetical protein EYP34_03570 [Chromatiaceae bacterium]|nr:hypothetical protein [Chromatiaceae bacterium]
MSHPFLKLAAIALALSGCADQYYDQGGSGNTGGYYPPYEYDAPRKDLIKNCHGKIREKVKQRLGHNARIDWGNSDVYNSGRHEATVNGKGKARHNGRKHQLHYRCIMDREDAFVRNAHIELDRIDSDITDWNQKAVESCKNRIRDKARHNIKRQFSMDFTRQRISTPAERRRHVSGEALIRSAGGSGKIAYDCKVRVNPLRMDSASYRWIRHLPPSNGGSNSSNAKSQARRLCKSGLNDRLRYKGYKYIGFTSDNVRHLKKNKWQVMQGIKAQKNGKRVLETWECRVNTHKSKILKLQQVYR